MANPLHHLRSAAAILTMSSPLAYSAVTTDFESNAVLSDTEIACVCRLGMKVGIPVVEKIRTYGMLPFGDRCITICGPEVRVGRLRATRETFCFYEKWIKIPSGWNPESVCGFYIPHDYGVYTTYRLSCFVGQEEQLVEISREMSNEIVRGDTNLSDNIGRVFSAFALGRASYPPADWRAKKTVTAVRPRRITKGKDARYFTVDGFGFSSDVEVVGDWVKILSESDVFY